MNNKETQKGSISNFLILLVTIIAIFAMIFLGKMYFQNSDSLPTAQTQSQVQSTSTNDTSVNTISSTTPETMSLTIFVQDKEEARERDCRITKKVSYQVPKTSAVADASLKLLFGGELAKYGVYKSVSITNGVAKVMLQSDMDPAGYPIGALSSCEVGHLQSVLNDTLKQYPTITSVELYSPEGKINF